MKKSHAGICILVMLTLCQMTVANSEVVHGLAIETEHLRIVWADEQHLGSLAAVERKSEKLFHETLQFVHDTPSEKITIAFRGRARVGPGPNSDYPFVNSAGVVSLFRFADDLENYFHAFVHELVHALRIDRAQTANWFFEEGFAEFVRLRVYEPMQGFPWHGYSPSIVAAGHIVEGSAIPLEMLRDRHEQLNMRCRAQAYALRAAFFEWLGDNFGDEPVLNMSQEPMAGLTEQYHDHFGKSFATLAKHWEEDMRNAHDAEKFKAYQTETPIRYIPLCEF